MEADDATELFLTAPPGLEPALAAEAEAHGFRGAEPQAGGVRVDGGWPEAWRANLMLRGAVRVLVRIAAFRVSHLAQLDKRAKKIPWGDLLRPDVPVRIEATCKRSRIYHSGAAAERIANAVADVVGAPTSADAAVRIMVRIEKDVCAVSVDTSGEPLHKRGFKEAVGKAPLRETMAALLLRECGFRGEEPVVDPMCGSGTLAIEAAEMALGFAPGRARRFAFEALATFDAAAWAEMKAATRYERALEALEAHSAENPLPSPPPAGEGNPSRETAPSPATIGGEQRLADVESAPVLTPSVVHPQFFGFDRDAGAIAASRENAERAGVGEVVAFAQQAISELAPPIDRPGLVIVNPPYGERIGDVDRLAALYGALGRVLTERFSGWRVGLISTEAKLARATRLPFRPPGPPIAHGPLRIRLHQTAPLP